jgi:hypothetical protein
VGHASLGSPEVDPGGAGAHAPRGPAVPVAAQPGGARMDALAGRRPRALGMRAAGGLELEVPGDPPPQSPPLPAFNGTRQGRGK